MGKDLNKVMSKNLKTIMAGTSLFIAQNKMTEHRIRHLPVVDETDEIVGVLSQRDVRAAQGALDAPVDFFMSAPVEYLAEDTSIRTAALRMIEKKISCLLIADKNNEAIGIVTTDDLLWFLAHQIEDENKKDQPLVGAMTMQTIGQVATMLSNMGI